MPKGSDIEEAMAALGGEKRCRWCGGHHFDGSSITQTWCSRDCEEEQYRVWTIDVSEWTKIVTGNGAILSERDRTIIRDLEKLQKEQKQHVS